MHPQGKGRLENIHLTAQETKFLSAWAIGNGGEGSGS